LDAWTTDDLQEFFERWNKSSVKAVPSKKKRPSDLLERLEQSKKRTAEPSVLFDGNRADLDKRMFMMVRFPVSFVAVPISFVMAVPISVIPIVVPAVVVSSGRK
jgi:hypothetical protein